MASNLSESDSGWTFREDPTSCKCVNWPSPILSDIEWGFKPGPESKSIPEDLDSSFGIILGLLILFLPCSLKYVGGG